MKKINKAKLGTFAQRVYQQLRTVPAGRVTTYKHLAESLGSRAYQAVGQALKHNPDASRIPCHRVVKTDASIGGFNGQTSGRAIQRKKALLQQEGIEFKGNKIKNFKQICLR